jgi:CRP-like cAMP-binding protein
VQSTRGVSTTNRLLAAMSSNDRQLFLASCEPVDLKLTDVLNIPGEHIDHVYFPTDSIISVGMPIKGGTGLEVRLIGNEGMLGVPLILEVDVAPFRAVVQKAGPALRITVPSFLNQLDQNPALQKILKRYLFVTISQLAQATSCVRYHVVEERLARLFLMTRDRAHSNEFHITHELLAQMLGVRRVGVTKAASSLHRKKLISYSRGDVRIQNIAGLEAASCECYRADKETYNRILGLLGV